MRIVVDVMGGDRGPETVVDGARLALSEYSSISELYLVGPITLRGKSTLPMSY